MPRRRRAQYEDALYHVINRGNYRLALFTSVGAARCFETTLGEASEMHGWQRALAREYSHLKLDVGLSAGGVRELNEARWCDALVKALHDCGHGESDIAQTPPSTPWKIAIAAQLRREAAAPYSWIFQTLNLGNLNTLRLNVRRSQLLHHALA